MQSEDDFFSWCLENLDTLNPTYDPRNSTTLEEIDDEISTIESHAVTKSPKAFPRKTVTQSLTAHSMASEWIETYRLDEIP